MNSASIQQFDFEGDFDAENGDVVIYARYSSEKQNEQSIEGQLRCCYEYAARRGFRVVGEYIDKALSGTKAETRPEFQRLIADSRKRQFKFVLVWKLDRFARNRYDSAIYKNELKKSGVRVVSVTEGVGDGNESVILEAILEAMAEEYSRQLSQNVRRGLHETALKGNSVGGRLPLGYRVENKKLVIDEHEAEIVRYIFKEYAAGVGKKEIVRAMNARGWRTRQGASFTMNALGRTLSNKKYIGIYTYNSEIQIEGGCPAIVDEDMFNKVSRIVEKTKKSPAHNKTREEDYILSGKLFCGYCGAPMVGESGKSKSGTVYHYYACGKRKKSRSCHKKNEKKGFIEWYIVEQVVEYVLTPSRIDLIAERVVEEYNKGFNSSGVKALEAELREIDRDLDKLIESLIKTDSKAALAKINERIAAQEARKETCELELAKLKIAASISITQDEVKAWLRQFCTGDTLNDEDFRRRIIDVFINSIYLYDDKVVMYFNIRDGKQISYIEMLESTEEPGAEVGDRCSDLKHDGSPIRKAPLKRELFLLVIAASS